MYYPYTVARQPGRGPAAAPDKGKKSARLVVPTATCPAGRGSERFCGPGDRANPRRRGGSRPGLSGAKFGAIPATRARMPSRSCPSETGIWSPWPLRFPARPGGFVPAGDDGPSDEMCALHRSSTALTSPPTSPCRHRCAVPQTHLPYCPQGGSQAVSYRCIGQRRGDWAQGRKCLPARASTEGDSGALRRWAGASVTTDLGPKPVRAGEQNSGAG